MSASTESVTGPPASARQWLDALVNGACDSASFLRGVDTLVQTSGDEAWEVLSLLDQYYRRGKLPLEQFRSLKAHVDRIALAVTRDASSRPRAAPTAEPVVAPAPTPEPVVAPAPTPEPPVLESAVPESGTSSAAVSPSPADWHAAGSEAAPATTAGEVPGIGTVLRGRYELVAVLGRGGMGTVFEAIDRFRADLPQASHRVAVKILNKVISDRPDLFDELRSEFQHLQSLSHPNIIRVHELDRDGETLFFTMELLNGSPLSRVLGSRPDAAIGRPYALAIIRDIGAAVAHAHSRNVVHGDLNPQNIFVTQAGEVRVLDFGASHKLKRAPWVSDFEAEQQASAAAPAFGSCEVLAGETADVRDDIYAFACVIYMLLAGRHPFQSRTAIEARDQRLVPTRPSGLASRQWRLLRAGLAFERERRPMDVEQWLRDLRLRGGAEHLPNLAALVEEPARRNYSNLYLALALGLVALGGVALWTATKRDAPVGISLAPTASTGATAEPDALGASTVAAPLITAPTVTGPTVAGPTVTAPATTVPAAPPAAAQPAAPPTTPATAPAVAPPAAFATTRAPPTGNSGARPAAPRSRIELTAPQVEVMPGESVAHVTVRRKGSLQGDVSYMWWTEPGTAKAGADFSPSAPHIEHMGNGQSTDTLLIPIVSNPGRRSERSFYFVIDDAGPDSGAAVVGRTTVMITILP